MITPIVKPVNVKENYFKQSKYDVAPRLPFFLDKEYFFSQ